MSALWQDYTTTAAPTATEWAKHRGWCRRLYWLMAVGGAALMIGGAFDAKAQDTVPRELMGVQTRTLEELRAGESACTYLGWRVSKEGHVWLLLQQKAELPCAPSVNHALVRRLTVGWQVTVKAPVPVNDWDAAYAGRGWTRVLKVEVVK